MHEGGRVLVVDDEEVVREVVAMVLADEGYEVRTAANGREALGQLGSWRPDLIVLDLMMPTLDGQAFRAAQRHLADGLDAVPVVVLSAARDVAAQAERLDAAAVVRKPFELDDVLAAVEHAVLAAR